uniref:Uncharacterized protein n=1 Tax=Leersia perrieri TaxID=77586 RepID=A0A0D9VDT8_9ORYZ
MSSIEYLLVVHCLGCSPPLLGFALRLPLCSQSLLSLQLCNSLCSLCCFQCGSALCLLHLDQSKSFLFGIPEFLILLGLLHLHLIHGGGRRPTILLWPDMNKLKNAASGEEFVHRPFGRLLAVLVPVDGDHGGAVPRRLVLAAAAAVCRRRRGGEGRQGCNGRLL